MNYAYIRVSTDRQTAENQRFEILKYADKNKIMIDCWIEETVSSRQKLQTRKIAGLIDELKKGDTLIVSELSRIGRNIMEVMTVLHRLMEKKVDVVSIKEGFTLADNIQSKVISFAFSLAGEIERDLISQRTREALARKKSEGVKLGRPKGQISKNSPLYGKEKEIKHMIEKQISYSAIGRLLGVHRQTVNRFLKYSGIKKGK